MWLETIRHTQAYLRRTNKAKARLKKHGLAEYAKRRYYTTSRGEAVEGNRENETAARDTLLRSGGFENWASTQEPLSTAVADQSSD